MGGSAAQLPATPILSPTHSTGSPPQKWGVTAASPKRCQQAAGSEQEQMAFHRGLTVKLCWMLYMLEFSQVQKTSGCFYLPSESDGFYHFAPVFGPFLVLRCNPESHWDKALPHTLDGHPRKPE